MRWLLLLSGVLYAFQVVADDVGCGIPIEASKAPGASMLNYEQSHARAECLRLAAARAGAEWLKTEELLQRSAEEASQGNWDRADQLVQKAKFQAEAALLQAQHESRAWKHRVVKK